MDAADFRRFAEECEDWARRTTNPSDRQIMRDLARSWIRIALAVERQVGVLGEMDRMRLQWRLRKLMD